MYFIIYNKNFHHSHNKITRVMIYMYLEIIDYEKLYLPPYAKTVFHYLME